LIISALTAPYI